MATEYPVVAFKFAVVLNVTGVGSGPVCHAAFSECDGLELTMDVKTIHEGGNNGVVIKLAGPVNYGQLTLRRGLTTNFDLWSWANAICVTPSLRTDGTVTIDNADGSTAATFSVRRCIPVKIKAPALNAKDGTLAIEEMQLAYESISLTGAGGAGAPAAGAGVSGGGGASAGISGGVGISGGISLSGGIGA
jgi:phage tail-like protein